MTYLIVTNDEAFSNEICEIITPLEKNAKFLISDFSITNSKKIIKSIDDISIAIFNNNDNSKYSENQIALLSNLTGFMLANNILIATNISFLINNIFTHDDLLIKYNSKEEIKNYIINSYNTICEKEKAKSAKMNLLKKGIPFTSDCFAYYITKNKTAICNLFINGGIDVNSKDDLGTPMLNIAVRNDNLTFVKKFIELGANINVVSEDRGYTPVMDAVWRGNEDILKYLIKHGADLNTISKEGQSNLVLAVGANKFKICKLLVENGSDPDVKDMMGMSAYGYATLFKKQDIIDILKPYHKE